MPTLYKVGFVVKDSLYLVHLKNIERQKWAMKLMSFLRRYHEVAISDTLGVPPDHSQLNQ